MTMRGDAAVGDSRTDDPHDVSPAATRRRDDRTAAFSYLSAAIARLDVEAAARLRPRRETADARPDAAHAEGTR